jgi:hypothetical protein
MPPEELLSDAPKPQAMCIPIFAVRLAPSVARVLLPPFRPRAAHIVSLGPVGVEQRGRQPAPPPSGPVETARQRRERQQHSQ